MGEAEVGGMGRPVMPPVVYCLSSGHKAEIPPLHPCSNRNGKASAR